MALFLQSLKQNGHLAQIHMTICSVGSRKLDNDDDYGSSDWNIFAPNLTIYGFDADADACEAANTDLETRAINWTEKHIPLALAESEGETTLYVTQQPACSSLYPPDDAYMARFTLLPELASFDFSVEIETTTLDSFLATEGVQEVDFLQIDVQGADLQVLKGAAEVLERSVLAVQIEVEFAQIYQNQPLFADIDSHLRKQGFTLFDLYTTPRVRACSPVHSTLHPGQLLWGEAFYLRDLLQPQHNAHLKSPEKIFKLACVADAMNFSDYALELLRHLTLEYGENPTYNFAAAIVTGLAQIPELVEHGLDNFSIVQDIQPYLNAKQSAAIGDR
jgi:FkbM family methyltransferase